MSLRSLICLALIHMLVDTVSQVVTPLWPSLRREFGLEPWSLTLLIACWQMATSVSQPFFGYWGDRFGSRWMLALGPALAVVCIGAIGYANGPVTLTLLLIAGGMGIGAFHPEAAVGVVEDSGTKPANGLALFTFGGMLGLGVGPIVSGNIVDRFGLHGLAWLLPPGLLLLATLVVFRRSMGHHLTYQVERTGLGEALAGRWLAGALLLAVATLRVVPALGVPLALAFLLDQQGRPKTEIGWSQSLFLLSGGLGTLVCPLLTRAGRELTSLALTTFLAAGCLLLLTHNQPLAYYAGLVGSGFLIQGAIPILLAYSQRLLPRGRRLAASLTLGASWGLGGMIVAGLQAYFTAAGRVEGMVWMMVPFALAGAVCSLLLPRLPVDSDAIAVLGTTEQLVLGEALDN